MTLVPPWARWEGSRDRPCVSNLLACLWARAVCLLPMRGQDVFVFGAFS